MTGEATNDAFGGRFVLMNRVEEFAAFEERFLAALEQHGYDKTAVFAVRLALEEAFNNASQHGNAGRPDSQIVIACRVTPADLVIEVEDEGDGFDPDRVPDPTAAENLEIPTGRGIMLIRAYMSEVEFIPPGNRVRMVYRNERYPQRPGE